MTTIALLLCLLFANCVDGQMLDTWAARSKVIGSLSPQPCPTPAMMIGLTRAAAPTCQNILAAQGWIGATCASGRSERHFVNPYRGELPAVNPPEGQIWYAPVDIVLDQFRVRIATPQTDPAQLWVPRFLTGKGMLPSVPTVLVALPPIPLGALRQQDTSTCVYLSAGSMTPSEIEDGVGTLWLELNTLSGAASAVNTGATSWTARVRVFRSDIMAAIKPPSGHIITGHPLIGCP